MFEWIIVVVVKCFIHLVLLLVLYFYAFVKDTFSNRKKCFDDVLNDFIIIIIIIIIKDKFSVLQNILLSYHVWGLSMHLYFLVLSTNSLLYL